MISELLEAKSKLVRVPGPLCVVATLILPFPAMLVTVHGNHFSPGHYVLF